LGGLPLPAKFSFTSSQGAGKKKHVFAAQYLQIRPAARFRGVNRAVTRGSRPAPALATPPYGRAKEFRQTLLGQGA